MQQQQVLEHKQFLNQRADQTHQINMQLIAKTSLDQHHEDEEKQIQALIALRSIHLEWLNIKIIENLQVFEHLNVLYLQHNQISKIQGLEHLVNLEYLALNDNRISTVENIRSLKKLQGLNLSNNQIESFEAEQLPEQLQVLSLKNNPVTLDVDYKMQVLKHLKKLDTLDDLQITPIEKFKLLGLLPPQLAGYAAQMNHFRTKQNIKNRLQETPLLFNTDIVNEKEALGEVREKTRKYLYQNQESFKHDQAELGDVFDERIQVSRKIRDIKESEQKERLKRIQQIKQSTLDRLSLHH